MFDTIGGLPIHPLAVHAVVVLLPLACLFTLAVALLPRFRAHARYLVVFNAVVAIAAFAAKESGERLDKRFRQGATPTANLLSHEEWGGRLAALAVLLAGAALVLWLLRTSKWGRLAGLGAAVLALAIVGVTVYVGDTGARDVWSSLIQNTH